MLYGPHNVFGQAALTPSQRAAQERHKATEARIADAARRHASGGAVGLPVGPANFVRSDSSRPAMAPAEFFQIAWRLLGTPAPLPAGAARPVASVQRIQQVVCEYYQITAADLTAACRAQEFAMPRQVAMYLCRTLTGRSLPDLGRRFGDRRHTTVLHATRKVAARLQRDPRLAQQIEAIVARLGAAKP